MFEYSKYNDDVYKDFKINGVKKLKAVIKFNNDFLMAAEKLKTVVNDFNGKAFNKKFLTALHGADERFLFESDKWGYRTLKFNALYNFYNIYVFSSVKMFEVEAEKITPFIDREIERTIKENEQIKKDIKNIKSKIKKIHKLADQYNECIESFNAYTLEAINIKYKHV